MPTGCLIAFEGTDGAGKSTLVTAVERRFAAHGRETVRVGRYLDPDLDAWYRTLATEEVTHLAAARLAADGLRAGFDRHVGEPLRRGAVVLADRYVDSHIAHFAVRGVSSRWLRAAFDWSPRPDLVVLLSIEPEAAIERLRPSGKPDAWEAGLDVRLADSPSALHRMLSERDVPAHERERHFVEHQRVLRAHLEHEVRTRNPRVLALPGSSPAEELLDAVWTALSDRAPCTD